MGLVDTDITVLSTREAIRKRPGMYLGALNRAAPIVLLREALCYPRALARDGKLASLEITLSGNNHVNVYYKASLPVCETGEDGRTRAERWFEDIYGCRDDKAEELKKELCSYGLVAANALSAFMSFDTVHDGTRHSKIYRQGEAEGPCKATRSTQTFDDTLVAFRPDPTIFPADRITMDMILGLGVALKEFQAVVVSAEGEKTVTLEF